MSNIVSIAKKIATSKWLRIILSVTLIYFAFRRVDLNVLATELSQVPLWFTAVMVIYYFLMTFLGGWRWSLLLVKHPTNADVWNFTRSYFIGGFYSLVFPSGLAGDLIKWMHLQKEYPYLTKTKLLGSSLLDRVVGLTAFTIVAFIACVAGILFGLNFPFYIFYIFTGLFLGIMVFYFIVFNFKAETWLDKFPKLKKIDEIIELIKGENKSQLVKAVGVAFLTELAWITPIWLISQVIGAGMNLLSVFVFMPVIALILVLPISIAGIGAREQLFLYFFTQVGAEPVKALAVATFNGIVAVIIYLMGGIFLVLQNIEYDSRQKVIKWNRS